MDMDREKLVAARAYELWEQEGRPDGAHERHWHQAILDVQAVERKAPARRKANGASKTSGPKRTKAKSAQSN